jgi:kinesin family protein 3/17
MATVSPFSDGSSVGVALRVRPLNKREKELKSPEIARVVSANTVHMDDNPGTIADEAKDYGYDWVYGQDSKQADFYESTASKVLDKTIEGFNACIFACEWSKQHRRSG